MAITAVAPKPVFADLAGRSRLKDAAAIGLGAAWVAALGQVSIPLGFTPVPLSLGTFAVLTAGTVLGARRAALSMVLFLAAGLAGAPVFAGGAHGLGVPTLGYLVGYVAGAGLAGWAASRGADRKVAPSLGVMAAASATVYVLGVPYLAWVADLSVRQALMAGLVPFLVGDAIKVVAASALFPAAWKLVGHLLER
ncbi:MAG: biotin transporter BioY [Bifidobacteriaceae bacterium]|jgi:biotin transport system substrate-specific component|nr:biotin transporter BioY [Bifidobacteriaceae bacterium]